MKHSLIFGITLSVAAMAATCVQNSWRAVVDATIFVARAAKNLLIDGFALFGPAEAKDAKQEVWVVQAKAFMLRLAKRERPVLSASWRWCPST